MGIKREEFARSIGMSYKTLANFEGGNNPISDEFLFRIAGGLNLTQDDLFDPNLESRLRSGLAISKTEPAQGGTVKPEPAPLPVPKFEDFAQLLRQMTPAQRDAIIEVMRVMADGNLKKIGVGADR